MQKQRLSKIMAERGLCSRREADRYIGQGMVLVDGRCVSELGTKIYPDQDVCLTYKAHRLQKTQITILLNKPPGYVSGQPEQRQKPAVTLISGASRWAGDRSPEQYRPDHRKGLAPAGRLDIDSTGLLVLTQDGRIARKLIGEHSEIDKEYLVRVTGTLCSGGLALLNHGLSLDGKKLKPAQVVRQNKNQLRFILNEGRKRQIRRMCELVGLHVTGLKRIRIGQIRLGRLPAGQWRYLGKDEMF